jgi:hypothetical protein
MIIISHRGYWKDIHEKNKPVAFDRSFKLGFGTETDIRDYMGELVISHDIANEHSLPIDDFLEIYSQYREGSNPPLALNVKSDGLQGKVKQHLKKFDIDNFFFFDMSIPDMLGYIKNDLNTFARISEYEGESPILNLVQGIWLDGFSESIVDESLIKRFIDEGKQVCMVSPELHRRPHLETWKKYKYFAKELINSDKLILCTDIPEEAKEFFDVQ